MTSIEILEEFASAANLYGYDEALIFGRRVGVDAELRAERARARAAAWRRANPVRCREYLRAWRARQ